MNVTPMCVCLIFSWINILNISSLDYIFFIFLKCMLYKFHVNHMLFTIQLRNSSFMYDFKIQELKIKTFDRSHSY